MEFTSIEIIYTLGAVLTGAVIILALWIKKTGTRITKLTAGRSGQNLEEVINSVHQELSGIRTTQEELNQRITALDRQMDQAVRGVGVVRFNPFKGNGGGGDQSFAVALIDRKGNGVVFSSIYSRERVSVYSKPIQGLSSTFELSDEEKQALQKARATL